MKKRLVVKIGSSLLTQSSGRLSLDKLGHHVDAIVEARQSGYEMVVVSSGAVAAGFESFGFERRPDSSEARQACAAVGQGMLIRAYSETFGQHGLRTAQILLSRRDFAFRESYNNALKTIEYLIANDVIPIVNENDTVATKDTKFGDNDLLAALVATLVHADLLVIFTDTAGLYTADPAKYPEAQQLAQVDEITPEILQLGGASGTKVGTGGMEAKLRAAARALSMGVQVFIGDGTGTHRSKVADVLNGKGSGTMFGTSDVSPVKRKKQWIAYHSEPKGRIVIDDGAVRAISEGGKSLLPAGVMDVFGEFASDDVVEVYSSSGRLVGKGVVQYAARELDQVRGKSTQFAKSELDVNKVEVIHRDNWVLFES